MVKRDILAPTARRLVEQKFKALEAATKSQATVPTGIKDLGDVGDIVWDVPDAGSENEVVTKSIKELDGILDDTRADLSEAIAALAELNNVTIPEMEEALSGLGDLDAIRDELENLGDPSDVGRIAAVGPPPADPVIGKSIWIAPNGRVFRAVECEEA